MARTGRGSGVQVHRLRGDSLDIFGRGPQELMRQLRQRAGDRELITDLGDIAVGRVQPGSPNAGELVVTGCQPRLRARTTAVEWGTCSSDAWSSK